MNRVLLLFLISFCTALAVFGRGIDLAKNGMFIPYIPSNPVAEVGQNWEDCSHSKDFAELNSLTIEPEEPKRGENVSVTIVMTLNEEVSSGYVKFSISYDGFSIYEGKTGLCMLLSQFKDNPCPIPSGQLTFSLSEKIPSSLPSGEYYGEVVVSDQNGSQLGCVKFDFVLSDYLNLPIH